MTPVMRRVHWATIDDVERRHITDRGLRDIVDDSLRRDVVALIDDVRQRGDDAVLDATRRFDRIDLHGAERLRVSDEEIATARVDSALSTALADAVDHVQRFNEAVLARNGDWSMTIEPGATVGEKVSAIESVGLFVPGGKASYPSVAYQLAVPAVVAGVGRISLLVPPLPNGNGAVDPAVLVVARMLGITDVFRANGPAGIAALGFGTHNIPAVRKIVGPGSPAVTIAQVEMQRHGIATMMVLGPTESMLIASHDTDPRRAALDLLIEAEHGEDSTVFLVCDDAAMIDAIDAHLAQFMGDMPEIRRAAARASLGRNGGAVLVDSLTDAAAVANDFAPEHLQIAFDGARADDLIAAIHHAGEILVGQDTPFSAANFVLGCPASLPTSGFAKVSSGITVDAFLKRTAIARADATALARMSSTITTLADHEGFHAHSMAIRRRPAK
jgi:histidinol dehydrogenase